MGDPAVLIRDFVDPSDRHDLRMCLIELQDFERRLDPRLPSGADIADAYIPQMLQRCRQSAGKVLLATVDGRCAGYVTVLTKVQSEELHDGDVEFGLVPDLVVLKEFRKRGIGRKLLGAAEDYARQHSVKWLRIGLLAGNQAADDLYASMGFDVLYIEREKDLMTSS